MVAKKDQRVTSLFICHWSLQDPLCQSQSLAYLSQLTAEGHKFALITYEQAKYALTGQAKAAVQQELARQGIYWYPVRYHQGFLFLAKAFDFVFAFSLALYVILRHRPRVVHSRGSFNLNVAMALSRLCGLRFLYDADSMLSEEYVDTGHWAPTSLAYRATTFLEGRARRSADSIVVLTERLQRDFARELGPATPITVIPCCVDTSHFRFDPAARARRRAELGWDEARILVYVGKTGLRYLVRETLEFFKFCLDQGAPVRLLILSGDPPEVFHELTTSLGLEPDHYRIARATRQEIPGWLAAADAGLALIRSARCERGSSPVKIGEYLAVGLPVIITAAIGDYSELIEREQVGVVVRDFAPATFRAAQARLNTLWADSDLRGRCRAVAESKVALAAIGGVRYRAVYQNLLGVGQVPQTPLGQPTRSLESASSD